MMRVREFDAQRNEADRNRLAPAYLDIWNAPENLKYLSYTLLPFQRDQVLFWLESHRDRGGHFWGAVGEDGTIQGIAAVTVNPVMGMELIGLGVRPSLQRKGIGKHLIDAVLDQAGGWGYQALETTVFADNKSMLRLLLGLDFRPIGMIHGKRADGMDLVQLVKRFPPPNLSSRQRSE